jgi:uncharacterized delta-60 repeat protein
MKLHLLSIALLITSNLFAQFPVRDTSFHFDGHVNTPMGINNDYANQLLTQSDGKIIAAGYQTDNPTFGPQRIALARYLQNGNIDSTFGVNGKSILAFSSQDWCNTAVILPNDKIIIAGQNTSGMLVARLNSNGNIDSTYGTNGITVLSAGAGMSSGINHICLLPDGSLIAAGSSQIIGSNDFELKIVKYTSAGQIDNSFGVNGIVMPAFNYITVSPGKVLVKNDGKILVAGKVSSDQFGTIVTESFLTQLNPDGSIDSSFANNGLGVYTPGKGFQDMVFFNNKIIAIANFGTNVQGTSGDIGVYRYNSDGSVDYTFGVNGSTSVFVDSYAEYGNALVVQPDGGILVGGSFFNFGGGTGTDCLILRFLYDGTIDTSFGINGIFKTGVSSGTDAISDMLLTSDNNLVVCGYGHYINNFDFIVGKIKLDIYLTVDIKASTNSELQLYPNPVHDVINIISSNASSGYDFVNMQGQCVKTVVVNKGLQQINIEDLTPGVYIMSKKGQSKIYYQKIIKH